MTPEQRYARFVELQAKIDAVTEWNRQHPSEGQLIEDAQVDGQRGRSAKRRG